jgi:large subunit ribosomal protein L13
MKTLTKMTPSANKETAVRRWLLIDAENKVLGRLSAKIATLLRGKHKPEYTPHADTGDYIIVINAEKIRVTGNKRKDKIYYSHSGYPGGLKTARFDDFQRKHPEAVIEKAVKNMMPGGPLANAMLKKLKVYTGSAHPHAAQEPQTLSL